VELDQGIRQHGFRKWYERELLQSHAHLVLTFLCTVGMLGAFEAMREAPSAADRMFDVFAIVLCGGVGLWALRRYLRLLMRAEHVANQADCSVCGAYGRLKLVGRAQGGVEVACRGCDHRWRMHDG
jgi:ABC-type nickel/cobalt efflux system permease component RcnA